MSQTEQNAYIAQLTPQEKKVLQIAREHLETSFSLVKSIGFQQWQQAATPAPAPAATPAPAPAPAATPP